VSLPPSSEEFGALSGAFMLRHRELVRARYGETVLAQTLASLTPEQQSAVRDATPFAWVPIATVEAFYEQLGRVVGRPPAELHYEIGPLVIEHTVKTVWRILLRLTSDESLVARVPVFYPKSWNRGHLVARLVGRGRAEARLDGWPNVPEYTLRGLCIAFQTTLRLAGRKDIETSIERREDGASIQMRWRA
jgi:hypothetical protein